MIYLLVYFHFLVLQTHETASSGPFEFGEDCKLKREYYYEIISNNVSPDYIAITSSLNGKMLINAPASVLPDDVDDVFCFAASLTRGRLFGGQCDPELRNADEDEITPTPSPTGMVCNGDGYNNGCECTLTKT